MKTATYQLRRLHSCLRSEVQRTSLQCTCSSRRPARERRPSSSGSTNTESAGSSRSAASRQSTSQGSQKPWLSIIGAQPEPIQLPNNEVYTPRYRVTGDNWWLDKDEVFDEDDWDAAWRPDPLSGRAASERDPEMKWGEVSWMGRFGPKMIKLAQRPATKADQRRMIFTEEGQQQQQQQHQEYEQQQQQPRVMREQQRLFEQVEHVQPGVQQEEEERQLLQEMVLSQQPRQMQQRQQQKQPTAKADPFDKLVERFGSIGASSSSSRAAASGPPVAPASRPGNIGSSKQRGSTIKEPAEVDAQNMSPAGGAVRTASRNQQQREPPSASTPAPHQQLQQLQQQSKEQKAAAPTAAAARPRRATSQQAAGPSQDAASAAAAPAADAKASPPAAAAQAAAAQGLLAAAGQHQVPTAPTTSAPRQLSRYQLLLRQRDQAQQAPDQPQGTHTPAPPPPPPPAAAASPRYQALLNLQDKTQLSSDQAELIAHKLRTPAPQRSQQQGQQPFRIFRYAVDDLRLFKALEHAGMAGRVLVVDSIRQADAVLAVKTKRTGKQVSLKEVQAAAKNAGLPFLAVKTVSAQRVMEALAPVMGIEVPEHLRGGGQPPGPVTMKREVGDGWELLAQVMRPGQDELEFRSSLMADPDLDDVDVNEARQPTVRQIDTTGKQYKLIRPPRWGSRIAKRRLRKQLAELRAPW